MVLYGSLLDVNFTFLQNQVFTDDSLPNILDVLNDSLEVARRIVRASDEDVVSRAI